MSENLMSIFPKTQLKSLIDHAKALDVQSGGFRADAANEQHKAFLELVACIPQIGGSDKFNRDAAESIFVARQLEFIRQGVIDTEFAPMKASMLVPFDTSPDEGAEQYTVTYANQAGEVRVSKDMTGIIPNVDVSVGQKTYEIYSLLQAYGYSFQEARAAMREHKPLAADRALRCREQIDRKIDAIALLGELVTGMKGLFNLASTLTYATPLGTQGVKTWCDANGGVGTKSSAEVLADWNGSVSKVVVNSKEVETPNTTVLPTSIFEYVTVARIGDGTSDTIATFFKRNNPHIKRVESSHKLEASAANWTGRRMVNYEKNPLKIAMILPVPFEQLMPDVTSTQTNTVCHARTAGVIALRPSSLIYTDEI